MQNRPTDKPRILDENRVYYYRLRGGDLDQNVDIYLPDITGGTTQILATQEYIDTEIASISGNYVEKTGDTMTGTLEFLTPGVQAISISGGGNGVPAVRILATENSGEIFEGVNQNGDIIFQFNTVSGGDPRFYFFDGAGSGGSNRVLEINPNQIVIQQATLITSEDIQINAGISSDADALRMNSEAVGLMGISWYENNVIRHYSYKDTNNDMVFEDMRGALIAAPGNGTEKIRITSSSVNIHDLTVLDLSGSSGDIVIVDANGNLQLSGSTIADVSGGSGGVQSISGGDFITVVEGPPNEFTINHDEVIISVPSAPSGPGPVYVSEITFGQYGHISSYAFDRLGTMSVESSGDYYTKTEVDSLSGNYVNVTGDTMTGDLTIDGADLKVQNTGTAAQFYFDRTDGKVAAFEATGSQFSTIVDNTATWVIKGDTAANIRNQTFSPIDLVEVDISTGNMTLNTGDFEVTTGDINVLAGQVNIQASAGDRIFKLTSSESAGEPLTLYGRRDGYSLYFDFDNNTGGDIGSNDIPVLNFNSGGGAGDIYVGVGNLDSTGANVRPEAYNHGADGTRAFFSVFGEVGKQQSAADVTMRVSGDTGEQTGNIFEVTDQTQTFFEVGITGDVTVQTLSGGVNGQIVTVAADGTLQNSSFTVTDLQSYSGTLNASPGQLTYSVSHPSVSGAPLVSLTVPGSASDLYVQAVSNVTTTGFDVILSGTPDTSGYEINWSRGNISGELTFSATADQVSYNNGTSGLTATNVQAAIDEVVETIPSTSTQTGGTSASTFVVDTIPLTDGYNGANWTVVVESQDESNMRTSSVIAVWKDDGSSVQHAESSSLDIGDTSPVALDVALNGSDIELQANITGADTWNIKSVRVSI
jgi:hypothetical protein